MIGAELIKEHAALRRCIVAEVVGAGVSLHIVGAPATDQDIVAGTDATGPGVFGSSANNTFGSATERFHFNTATNTLMYDSNGSTAGGTQVALAVLENSTVGAAQIHMV